MSVLYCRCTRLVEIPHTVILYANRFDAVHRTGFGNSVWSTLRATDHGRYHSESGMVLITFDQFLSGLAAVL